MNSDHSGIGILSRAISDGTKQKRELLDTVPFILDYLIVFLICA